ncbi:MAG: hypothetical protein ACI4D3_09250 [Lachnospiraceae bacterium]
MMNLTWIPEADSTGVSGTEIQIGAIQAQAAEAYQHFYFQGGLFMLPKTSLSFTWTYMKKGDRVQFVVKSNGTLYVGITRMSDKKMIGFKRSNNFTVSLKVPSSDYYRVYIVNNSTRAVSLRGVAVCSR